LVVGARKPEVSRPNEFEKTKSVILRTKSVMLRMTSRKNSWPDEIPQATQLCRIFRHTMIEFHKLPTLPGFLHGY